MSDYGWQDPSHVNENDPVPDGGLDIWTIANRRKWLIIIMALVGLGLGYLHYVRATPIYESVTQVAIERNMPMTVPLADGSGMNPMMRTDVRGEAEKHTLFIQSPENVGRAILEEQLDTLKSLSQPGAGTSAGEVIIENLTVQQASENVGIYNISFQSTDLQDAQTVVGAVSDTYKRYLEKEHKDVGKETRDLITRAKDELLKQILAKEDAYEKFKQEAPLMWKDGEGTNLHQARQANIEAERGVVLLKLSNAKSQLDAIVNAVRNKKNMGAIMMAAKQMQPELAKQDPASRKQEQLRDRLQQQSLLEQARRYSRESSEEYRQEQAMLPLKIEEEDLLARYGKDHPRVKSIRRRISSTSDFLGSLKSESDDEIREQLEAQRAETYKRYAETLGQVEQKLDDTDAEQEWQKELIANFVGSLQQQIEQLETHLAKLDEMFSTEAIASKSLAMHQERDRKFRVEIQHTQEMFDVVKDQLSEINFMDEYDGYKFATLAPPSAGKQVWPSIPKSLGFGLFGGGLLGLGLAILVDMADKSFHSPLEISQALDTQIIGHVPLLEKESEKILPDAEKLVPQLVTVHQPKSPDAEAYRTIRTALYFSARGKQHNLIQVTSPRPGDGKSTVSANLAVSIAESGKSVLLLDSDLRRPTQHRNFNLSSKVGLADCVAGTASPDSAYQKVAAIPNLTLMACGPRPHNPSELVSSKSYGLTLQYLKTQFDFVIVDTPPVLAVSDPSAVAAQVDGVILTIRLHNEAKPTSTRSCEILREIGANLLGVVINGVGSFDTRAYDNYGRRSYGYGKGYGYMYASTYGADGDTP